MLTILHYLGKYDLVTAAAACGTYLGWRLREALGELPCVGDVCRVGVMWGVDFVTDRKTKVPFPPELHFGRRSVVSVLWKNKG